jgi:hypothetical protein
LGTRSIVEVSRDEGFSDVVLRREIVDGSAQTEFSPSSKGRYFWRVTRLAGNSQAASAVAAFEVRRRLSSPVLYRPRVQRGITPVPARGPIEPPVLGRPVIRYQKESYRRDPGVTAMRFALGMLDWMFGTEVKAAEGPAPDTEKKPSRYEVDLDWEAVGGAKAYLLQISASEDFSHPIAEKITEDTTYRWRTDIAGSYYWRVAAIDPEGERGPFSEFNTFSIRAERNRQGDETTYDTYMPFDDYAKYRSNLRLTYGPVYSNYYFSSSRVDSPASVIFRKRSWLNGQVGFDYRVTPYYSLQFAARQDRATLDAADYESRPTQEALTQTETVFGVGVERRFFKPRHYFMVQGGVRVSYIDIPVLALTSQLDHLVFNAFGFFGPYAAIGARQLLGRDYDAGVILGGMFQYSGDSSRYSQYAAIEARRTVADWMHVGVRIDEIVSAYRFAADNLEGSGHSLTLRPLLIIDMSF